MHSLLQRNLQARWKRVRVPQLSARLVPECHRRHRLLAVRARPLLCRGGSALAAMPGRHAHEQVSARDESGGRLHRVPDRHVLSRGQRGGHSLRCRHLQRRRAAGLVHKLCAGHLCRCRGRHGVQAVRGGRLLPPRSRHPAALQAGLLLQQEGPLACLRVRALPRRPRLHERRHRASAVQPRHHRPRHRPRLLRAVPARHVPTRLGRGELPRLWGGQLLRQHSQLRAMPGRRVQPYT